MIVRIWTGEAFHENAEEFRHYFHEVLMPKFRATEGFIRAEALERFEKGRIEFVVISRWDNYDAIRAFAGSPAERAVLEPDIRAALVRFDDTVKHFIHLAEEKK